MIGGPLFTYDNSCCTYNRCQHKQYRVVLSVLTKASPHSLISTFTDAKRLNLPSIILLPTPEAPPAIHLLRSWTKGVIITGPWFELVFSFISQTLPVGSFKCLFHYKPESYLKLGSILRTQTALCSRRMLLFPITAFVRVQCLSWSPTCPASTELSTHNESASFIKFYCQGPCRLPCHLWAAFQPLHHHKNTSHEETKTV